MNVTKKNDPKPTNREQGEKYGLPGEDKGYKRAECSR